MRHITAAAPTRFCDCGGWTDTWFARHGWVFHIAIEPGVEVDVDVRPLRGGEAAATIDAVNFGDAYTFSPDGRQWGAHPLIEAAIASVGVPPDVHVVVRVQSAMPPGASVGTSASVSVAVVGAMLALAGQAADPADAAIRAHEVETKWLGQQSGVQDQLAAAFGGINLVEIDEYPHTRVHAVDPASEVIRELQSRLMLVCLSRGHRSTAIHERVIREVNDIGPDHPALEDLRGTAIAARDAVVGGRMDRLGVAMTAATEAQRRLHPALVSAEAQRVIDAARANGAAGWKVNGAGGEGGSLTLLAGPDPGGRPAIEAAVARVAADCRVVPVRLANAGLTIS